MPTVAIRSGSIVLEGHMVPADDARAVMVLLHGIPGGGPPDPSDPGYPGFARTVASRGYAALHFDFRGTRGADGDFSFRGWQHDLNAALDALASGPVASLPTIVVGSSAGGSVAIAAVARRDDVAAVATLAAPAGFEALAGNVDGALLRFRNSGIIHDPAFPADPAAWWREFEDDAPELLIRDLAPRPVLIVHGDADPVVPYPHAERLFAACGSPKELVRIPGGGHQLRRDPRAVDALLDWADNLGVVP